MFAPPRASRVALWIFLASALICIFVYLAMTVQGPWFGSARTLHWTPGDLSVTGGSAQMRPDGLAVRASDDHSPVLRHHCVLAFVALIVDPIAPYFFAFRRVSSNADRA